MLEKPKGPLLKEKGYSDDFWSPEGTTGSATGSLMLTLLDTYLRFLYLFKEYLLNTYYGQAMLSVLGNTAMNKRNKVSITKLV